MNEMSQTMTALRRMEKKLFAYNYATAVIETDEATVAPTNGGIGRGEALEVLAADINALIADPALGGLLDEAAAQPLSELQAAEVRELRRQHTQYTKLPAGEYASAKRLFNDSRDAWHHAKQTNDFSLFAPWLERCLETRRRWAAYFAPEKSSYEVWLDQYQPGLTIEKTDAFFDTIRGAIVPLLREIQENGCAPRTDFLHSTWPITHQKQLSAFVMERMGLTKEHCVLGETEHPFTQQLYDEDVRITTHYYEDDFTSNLFSVIHEGGHALYERHISPALRYTVLAEGSCIGIHESQSRLFENYIGRSREFLGYLLPTLKELFPSQLDGVDAEAFYRAVNRVEPSLIRTEADELTYTLHVLIRYELEKQLFSGSLTVKELPAAWNRLYREYLGVTVPDDAHGVLQDVHWSQGDFGYFPGYALGTAYAAQMVEHMRRHFDFDACCRSGDFSAILDWQTQHLWQYGKGRTPAELIESACGGPFDPQPFIAYLNQKYREIYAL